MHHRVNQKACNMYKRGLTAMHLGAATDVNPHSLE